MDSRVFSVNRRGFIAGLGAFALSSYGAIDLAPQSSFKGEIKGRRLKIASVGCGGMGGAATKSLIAAGCDLVAVCDVDPKAFDAWEQAFGDRPPLNRHSLRQ